MAKSSPHNLRAQIGWVGEPAERAEGVPRVGCVPSSTSGLLASSFIHLDSGFEAQEC